MYDLGDQEQLMDDLVMVSGSSQLYLESIVVYEEIYREKRNRGKIK